MSYKLLPLLITAVWGAIALPLPHQADATTPLVRAVIKDLRNWVQLMPKNRPKRNARRSDAMSPGDGLSTGRYSLAELLFNDGSLARVGERAVFNFLARARNFRLNNGTVLLLIPPGRGRTKIRTPNAAAAIRGSALFVRHDTASNTTIVGALTNSGIEVFNQKGSRSKVLKAGQMMVVRNGRLWRLYEFDLRNFYRTSDLVKDLELDNPNSVVIPDPALATVRAETTSAIKEQTPLQGKDVVENPSFVALTDGKKRPDSEELDGEKDESEEDSSVIATDNNPVTVTDNNSVRGIGFVESGEVAGEQNNVETTSLTPTNNQVNTPTDNPVTPATPATPGSGTPATPATPAQPNPPGQNNNPGNNSSIGT